MEFYVAFRDLIGEDLVDVFNASLEAGLLPFSQRVFLSVVGVCLPRSPLLAVLGSSWLCFFCCFFFVLFFLLQCVRLPSLCSPSFAFVGCTAVFLGSELALLECFSFLSFVYSLLYCI